MQMTDFTGLVVVVTGGASGIGAATADLLLSRGARVAILDRALAAGERDRSVLAVPCDITDAAGVLAAIDSVAERLGGIDVLVNNAGIGAVGDITANDDDEWHRVLDVNVVGIARVTRVALPHLRRSAHAAIVNTCSVVASVGVSLLTVDVSLAALHGPATLLLLASPLYVARQRYAPAAGGLKLSDVAEPPDRLFVLTVVAVPEQFASSGP